MIEIFNICVTPLITCHFCTITYFEWHEFYIWIYSKYSSSVYCSSYCPSYM